MQSPKSLRYALELSRPSSRRFITHRAKGTTQTDRDSVVSRSVTILFATRYHYTLAGTSFTAEDVEDFLTSRMPRLGAPITANGESTTTIDVPTITWPNHELSKAILVNVVSHASHVSLHQKQGTWATKKNPLTFHYTGWLIGILIMVYSNPHIIG